MFGYIKPLVCELKVREKALFDANYCGLCRTIGKKYGQSARLALNYDSAFIALLLGSCGTPVRAEEGRCLLKPQRRRMIMPATEALEYAAAMNVLLAWYKLDDDWRDERSVKAKAASAAFIAAKKRAEKEYPGLAGAIKCGLDELSKLEAENCGELDKVCDAFANLMKNCLADWEKAAGTDEKELKIMRHIAYNMGRWVYLADAWDDREDDAKKGLYNPFASSGATVERAEFLMYMSLNEASQALDLLDITVNRELLENIIRLGCYKVTEDLISGKKRVKNGGVNESI